MRKWRCDCERYVGLKRLTSDLLLRRFEQQVRRIGGGPVGPKKWQAEALALQESVIGTTIRVAARFARLRAR